MRIELNDQLARIFVQENGPIPVEIQLRKDGIELIDWLLAVCAAIRSLAVRVRGAPTGHTKPQDATWLAWATEPCRIYVAARVCRFLSWDSSTHSLKEAQFSEGFIYFSAYLHQLCFTMRKLVLQW